MVIYTEFVKIKADAKTIESAGMSRRFDSCGVYQNITWEESSKGMILLNDNKGCYTEAPLGWCEPFYD